jgi:hypothetical protein
MLRPLTRLLLASLLATLAIAPVALAQAPAPTESYATLLEQLTAKAGNSQRVTAATVDKTDHHVRLTLANGSRPLVSYPPADDKFVVDSLIRDGIKPVYTKRPVVHHTLRYIAAGVVVVLLLIGAGVWFYTRGRPHDADTPAATPATH